MKKSINTSIYKNPIYLIPAAQQQVSQNQTPAPTPEEKAILELLAK
ncbi:hypothetical protein J5226_08410 [Lysobacter sp. K5869]|nr:hypothetical protein [Lysobacter sp. K5869]QWP78399.1 hypothetical protein J5226_08410 [Lysobacter sp. K5869]